MIRGEGPLAPTGLVYQSLPREGGSLEEKQWCVQFSFSSVTQSCPTLCNAMNHSTPGLPVHHQLPKFTQTHIHRVSDGLKSNEELSELLTAYDGPGLKVLSH